MIKKSAEKIFSVLLLLKYKRDKKEIVKLSKILIQTGLSGIKAVHVENKEIIDVYVENREESLVDNIYKGRVQKLAKGMEAAFVDIGLAKNGYLKLKKGDYLKAGDYIDVQVISDEHGQKGAKLSSKLAIAGKYLVIQSKNTVGISNRIKDESSRKRLMDMIEGIKPDDFGVIIRTQAKDASQEELEADMNYLKAQMGMIEAKKNIVGDDKLIYAPVSGVKRFVRDRASSDVDEIIIDGNDIYEEINTFFAGYDAESAGKLKLFDDNMSLFESFSIDAKLEKIFKNKIWLKSGGYLIIDKTEAMTVIDVNSGKHIGKSNFEDTASRTNLEAAQEVVNTVTLRNISGIIIVDFIDMKDEKNREKVIASLKKGFSKVKGKTQVYGFTKLGLVEIARRRDSKEYMEYLIEECKSCGGSGCVKRIEVVIDELDSKIMRISKNTTCEIVEVGVSGRIYEWLDGNEKFGYFGEKYGLEVKFARNDSSLAGEIDVIFMGSKNIYKKNN